MAGRPTKYKEEFNQIAFDYAMGGFKEDGQVVPSKVGLAILLGVGPNTLDDWAKVHDVFSTTLALVQSKQHVEALNRGLDSTFNAAITKLLLHNHGYSDKAAQEITGANGGPIEGTVSINFTPVGNKQ